MRLVTRDATSFVCPVMHGTARPGTLTARRLGRSTTLAAYAAGGAAWSVLARMWMRLLSTAPSFTWSGTLTIVGICTVAWLGCGIAAITRDLRPGARRVGTVVGSFLALAPAASLGMVLMPTALLGGAARGRPSSRRWVRVLVVVLAAAPVVALDLVLGMSDELALRSRVVALLITPLLCSLLCLPYAALFRRRPDSTRR